MGIKVGMTQIYKEDGTAIPVTVVEAGPCTVLQKKNEETDGYNAVQVGFYNLKEKQANKPAKGIFKKANVKPLRYIKEFHIDDIDNYEIGQDINVDVFQEGDAIDVIGTSKGKGFAGATKRHNFARGSMGHGSKYHRRVGSLGAKGPARVFKGRKLPGRMGGERVTVQDLKVVKVYPERNLILIKGSIPGPKRGLVIIKDSVKA
ncbi:MAG: 50S ribosomal protein L3 [Syntrophomonadaceae bacterium]|nr:50S ribosomal protein L3 [Syntrophomonadaceae bacterium]MDD3890275.1 50S ribosomal protein L3 [Syntrophomonadaceae bacterium]MDD4549311.1 50S ribosomal protein L3 [Syntrophomonadaceae bacterium]